MTSTIETGAFIHDWEYWGTHVASFMPPDYFDSNSEPEWSYCDILYTVPPLDGRHQDAMHTLQFEFNPSPTDADSDIGKRVATLELPLQTNIHPDGFVHFLALDGEGDRVLELRYDHEVAKNRLGEVSDFASVSVRLEYQNALLETQADQYESLAEARTNFVEYVTRKTTDWGGTKTRTLPLIRTNLSRWPGYRLIRSVVSHFRDLPDPPRQITGKSLQPTVSV